MTRAPRTAEELARAYAPILAPGEFFSHVTAAVLHGMRLPLGLPQLRLDTLHERSKQS